MDALVKLYGEGVIEELRYNNSITKQYKEYEIKEMIAVYKQKIKELEVK